MSSYCIFRFKPRFLAAIDNLLRFERILLINQFSLNIIELMSAVGRFQSEESEKMSFVKIWKPSLCHDQRVLKALFGGVLVAQETEAATARWPER